MKITCGTLRTLPPFIVIIRSRSEPYYCHSKITVKLVTRGSIRLHQPLILGSNIRRDYQVPKRIEGKKPVIGHDRLCSECRPLGMPSGHSPAQRPYNCAFPC